MKALQNNFETSTPIDFCMHFMLYYPCLEVKKRHFHTPSIPKQLLSLQMKRGGGFD